MKIHIVKKGESLYLIGQKYNVSQDELLKLNPSITNPDLIDVGMKLKIPSGIQHGGGMEIMHQHVVKQGDTLWKLAKAWGIPLADMIKANPHLKNPNVLLTGEIVNIPKAGSVGGGQVQGQAAANTANMMQAANANISPAGKANTGVQQQAGKANTGVQQQQQGGSQSLLKGVQGFVGKLANAAPILGKATQQLSKTPTAPIEKAPTAPVIQQAAPEKAEIAPIIQPKAPAPAAEPKAAKIEPLAAEQTLPLEKPVAKKMPSVQAEHQPSVDLFKQYGIPATEATYFYEMPKAPESALANVAGANKAPLTAASTNNLMPYCPPGTYTGGEQISIYQPYQVHGQAGAANVNAPFQPMSVNANMPIQPLSANVNAPVQLQSVNSYGYQPMSFNTNGFMQPLSANASAPVQLQSANANMPVQPLSANANASIQPLAANASANVNIKAKAEPVIAANIGTKGKAQPLASNEPAVLPAAEQQTGSYFGLSGVSPWASQGYYNPQGVSPAGNSFFMPQAETMPAAIQPEYGYYGQQGVVMPTAVQPDYSYGYGMQPGTVMPAAVQPDYSYGYGVQSGMVMPAAVQPDYSYGYGVQPGAVMPSSVQPEYGYGYGGQGGAVMPLAGQPDYSYSGSMPASAQQGSYYGYPVASLSGMPSYGGYDGVAPLGAVNQQKDDCGCNGARSEDEDKATLSGALSEPLEDEISIAVKNKPRKKKQIKTVVKRTSSTKQGSRPWINR